MISANTQSVAKRWTAKCRLELFDDIHSDTNVVKQYVKAVNSVACDELQNPLRVWADE